MRWEDERYVRIYTRDTVDWLGLSFIAQGLFCLILRKVDRAGLLKLGKPGKRAVSIVIGHPGDWPRLEPALEELLSDGCVDIRGEFLVVPNFIEAQECAQSDAQRKRESRAKARDIASAESLVPDISSRNVTEGHESGQKVTNGHEASRAVTSGHSVPCRTVPSVPKETLSLESERADATPAPRSTEGSVTVPVVAKPLPLDVCRAEWESVHPSTAAMLRTLATGGLILDRPRRATVSEGIERSVAQIGADAAAVVVRAAHQDEPSPHLGWYARALHEAAFGKPRKAKPTWEPVPGPTPTDEPHPLEDIIREA